MFNIEYYLNFIHIFVLIWFEAIFWNKNKIQCISLSMINSSSIILVFKLKSVDKLNLKNNLQDNLGSCSISLQNITIKSLYHLIHLSSIHVLSNLFVFVKNHFFLSSFNNQKSFSINPAKQQQQKLYKNSS